MSIFTKEQRVVILTSRLTFSQNDRNELLTLLNDEIDWFQVLRYAAKSKTIPLLYKNLCNYGLSIKKPARQIFKYYYLGTLERNKIILSEYDKLRRVFAQNNICMAPLKGAFLIPNLYIDLGIRTVNDIDCLIMPKDKKIVKEILTTIGYINGDYDEDNNSIIKISSKKNMLWKMNMNSLYPFRKIIDSPFAKTVDIDFSFALDFNKDEKPVFEMMNAGTQFRDGEIILQPYHFFIHQCCHHYKEASNAAWILKGSDFNLIKFCDVREYILKFMTSEDFELAISFANKYGFSEAVYFVLYYLKEIFNDGYEDKYFSQLKCNPNFIKFFGKNDFSSEIQWKKTFWERVFADNNKDEIDYDAKFLDLYVE